MKKQVRENKSELILVIGGIAFIVLGVCLYFDNTINAYCFIFGTILSGMYFIILDTTSIMTKEYIPHDLVNRKILWLNKIYLIKKYICKGNDIGICGKYECHCITNGTIEYIYEDEILQLLAQEQAELI